MVGRLTTDCPSYSKRGAVGDIFRVLAHSDWCRVCAGPAAHHQASEEVPNQESNAVVLANTRRHFQMVAGSNLVARSVPANRRVGAIGRVELFILGDGDVRTVQHGLRDASGKLPTRIYGGVAVEVACPSGRRWPCGPLPGKRDRRSPGWYLPVGRRQDCTPRGA